MQCNVSQNNNIYQDNAIFILLGNYNIIHQFEIIIKYQLQHIFNEFNNYINKTILINKTIF